MLMKNKLFMYLFLFSILLVIFLYMNHKRIYESMSKEVNYLKLHNELQAATITQLNETNTDLNYFTLLGNNNAMDYFEQSGYEAEIINDVVSTQIYAQNSLQGDNALIPYAGMEGIMKINKIRFLNHKWIIADFTDGRYWGEMIIQYDLDEHQNLTLNTLASFLYPAE